MVPDYMANQASLLKAISKKLDKNCIVKARLNEIVSHNYYFVDSTFATLWYIKVKKIQDFQTFPDMILYFYWQQTTFTPPCVFPSGVILGAPVAKKTGCFLFSPESQMKTTQEDTQGYSII